MLLLHTGCKFMSLSRKSSMELCFNLKQYYILSAVILPCYFSSGRSHMWSPVHCAYVHLEVCFHIVSLSGNIKSHGPNSSVTAVKEQRVLVKLKD